MPLAPNWTMKYGITFCHHPSSTLSPSCRWFLAASNQSLHTIKRLKSKLLTFNLAALSVLIERSNDPCGLQKWSFSNLNSHDLMGFYLFRYGLGIKLTESSLAHCWNFGIFLSSKFYMKSILKNLEVLKMLFLPFKGLWVMLIWYNSTFKPCKDSLKNQNSELG